MNGFQFKTQNGTVFQINRDTMEWTRIRSTKQSGITRRDKGKLLVVPVITIGQPAFLQDTDILPGHIVHFVRTSPVVSISEILT